MRRRGPTLAGTGAERYVHHAHDGTTGRGIACGGLAEGPPSHAAITDQAQRRLEHRRKMALGLCIQRDACQLNDAARAATVLARNGWHVVPITLPPGSRRSTLGHGPSEPPPRTDEKSWYSPVAVSVAGSASHA